MGMYCLGIDNFGREEGRLINNRLEEDLTASQFDLSAKITFDQELGELIIRLNKNDNVFPNTIYLEMSHPVVQALDQTLTLTHIAQGQYQAEVENTFQYRWYLRLRPKLVTAEFTEQVVDNSDNGDEQAIWRLRGQVDFAQQNSAKQASVLLTPDV